MTIGNKYSLRMGDVYVVFLCWLRMKGRAHQFPDSQVKEYTSQRVMAFPWGPHRYGVEKVIYNKKGGARIVLPSPLGSVFTTSPGGGKRTSPQRVEAEFEMWS